MARALCCVIMLSLLTSCGSGRTPANKKPIYTPLSSRPSQKKKVSFADIRIQEAKQADIPVPVSAKPLSQRYHVDADRVMLGYRDYSWSCEELIQYYEQEMERHGWRSIFALSGNESILHFEKPDRLCIVSIRPHASARYVDWIISAGYITKHSA